jgi:uncharacterized protein
VKSASDRRRFQPHSVAINRDAKAHEPALRWWENALGGEEVVALSWTVTLGFLRISTNARIVSNPLAIEDSTAAVEDWLAQPVVRVLEPTERHWPILRTLLEASGSAANLTSDAHLAALAIEHGAVLHSADRDFGRFAHLRWHNPLDVG